MSSLLKILVALSFILLYSVALTEIPKIINYQGYLTEISGNPVPDGDYLLKFTLWDDPTSTEPVNAKWSSGFQLVNVIDGSFTYLIGSMTPLQDDLFESDPLLYLGIRVGVDTEITPRSKIASSAFSFQALRSDSSGYAFNADLVDGQDASSFAVANHIHQPGDISPQGAASGLDADLLDGFNAGDLAMANHLHTPIDISPQGAASGLDADLLDGNDASSFAIVLHDHDSTYSQLDHLHDAGEIASGTISTDRYSALADLTSELAIGQGIAQIAAGDHDHGNIYANAIHSHNAQDISSGMLSSDRYSAFTDLVSESRIGSGGTQVAIGNHEHLSQYVDLITDQTIMGLKTFANTLLVGDSTFRADATGVRLGDNASPNDNSLLNINRTYNTGLTKYGMLTSVRNNSIGELYGHSSFIGTTTDGGGTVYGYFASVVNSLTSSNPRYGFFAISGSPNNTAGTSYGIKVSSWGGTGSVVYGIHASKLGSGSGYAGYFGGDVLVTGTLSKAAGSIRIDHPLDPKNMYLQHSMVESPDMMNIYNGNVHLNSNGEAVVTLPDYFTTLNRDFRYQLTCIGAFAPVYIQSPILNNQFTIAGGENGMEISWQVTGIRQDIWAEKHRIDVELQKNTKDRGKYLHYREYGVGIEEAVESEQVDKLQQK